MSKGHAGYKVREFICEGCGREVSKRCPPGSRYCSQACYRSSPRPGRRTGETRSCEKCGSSFYVAAHRISKGQGRFCSAACHNSAQGDGKTEHTCKVCGETFRWSPSRSKSGAYRITYCSLPCRDADPERRAMLLELNARQQRGKVTRAEMNGYSLLELAGCDYVTQPLFAEKFIPDAAVPSARLVVQFDGDYWHDRRGTSTEKRILRRVAQDRSQDAYVRACGWDVVRFWESDLRDHFDGCMAQLLTALSRPLGDAPARDPLARASSRRAT